MSDVSAKNRTLEERLQAIEDRLDILNLIAGHPPGADSASRDYAASYWAEDGIIDMSAERPAQNYTAMLSILDQPGFKEAQRQGICHFTGLPYIEIDGDRALATSYLQILAADPDGKPFELSAHGASQGFRVLRLSANRWELARTPEGWRIERRTIRSMDNAASRELLRAATIGRLAQ